jgi:hypothetical protein
MRENSYEVNANSKCVEEEEIEAGDGEGRRACDSFQVGKKMHCDWLTEIILTIFSLSSGKHRIHSGVC